MEKSWEPWQELITPAVDTVYDPPLRGLRVRQGGTLVLRGPRNAMAVTFDPADDELVPALVTYIDPTSTAGGFESGR